MTNFLLRLSLSQHETLRAACGLESSGSGQGSLSESCECVNEHLEDSCLLGCNAV
jgi:hypothetical protein